MQKSTDRFLTTHTGSLPRPPELIRTMFAREEGVPVDTAALAAQIREAVGEAVSRQVAAGVDFVNDGEMSKPSYATYVKDRLNGFGGTSNSFKYQDLNDFPVLANKVFGDPRPLAAQDAGLQRGHIGTRRCRGRHRCAEPAFGDAGEGRDAGLHERGFARRHRPVFPRRSLRLARGLPRRHR